MTQRLLRISTAFVFWSLLATFSVGQTHPTAPESPYGGTTVEDIVARVNDQIITQSDYDRAMKDMDDEMRQRGASMQDISEAHKDLLRNLIDQQLLLSKGKDLGITGDTELIQKLNEIRKQYNLETMEDLEKAAKAQGVSFEDFKANIRNGIITQEVLRDQVGRKVQFTPGELQRYYDEHKQEYAQPESVHLSEILVSVGAPGVAAPIAGMAPPADDPAALAAAKAKADDIEARLHAGGNFSQLAKSFSDGPTAAEGGDLGDFRRGAMNKVLEDATFALKSGQYTDPIRTKQGFVILDVVQHVPGGVPELKDVQNQVEDAFYSSRMEPAMREFQTTMREEAFIDIKPGYTDSGASPKETKPVYSAYTPPEPKKKKKVERTRFRESTRSFRQKTTQAAAEPADNAGKATKKNASLTTQKPGKKEKIRFGQAPTKTLPNSSTETATENAGAVEQAATDVPANPLETKTKSRDKTRYSARAKVAKTAKAAGPKPDKQAPAPPDAAEVADRQSQAAPLGLSGDTATKKKKAKTVATEKKRLAETKKDQTKAPATEPTPIPQEPGAPAPAPQTPPSAADTAPQQ